MQAKQQVTEVGAVPPEQAKTAPRPEGMQTMGTTLYAQIRRVLVELKLVSEN